MRVEGPLYKSDHSTTATATSIAFFMVLEGRESLKRLLRQDLRHFMGLQKTSKASGCQQIASILSAILSNLRAR